MRRKRFILFLLISSLAMPTTVYASTDVYGGVGDAIAVASHQNSGDSEWGEGSSTNESGGGGGGGSNYVPPSKEYTEAAGAKDGINTDVFQDAITGAKNAASFDKTFFTGSDLMRIGQGSISKSQLDDIEAFLKKFKENYDLLEGWERMAADGCNILTDTSLPDTLGSSNLDADTKQDVITKFYRALMGNEAFPGGAGSFNFDSFINGLDLSNLLINKKSLLGPNFSLQDWQNMLKDPNNWGPGGKIKLGDTELQLLPSVLKLLLGNGTAINYTRGDIHGLRGDLFTGGLDGFSSFSQSMDSFVDVHKKIFENNPGKSSIDLVYLEDNHITHVDEAVYTGVSFKSDKRLWTIYDSSGRILKQVETENADHVYIFKGFPKGDYVVVAQQWADYTIQQKFRYTKYEYVIDPITKTMLWARRSATNEIFLKNLRESGYRPNGEVFRIHINEFGEVENETMVSERVE